MGQGKYPIQGSGIVFRETFHSAADVARNGGTVNGGVSFSDGVATFDGVDGYCTIPNIPVVGNGDYSFELKIKTPNVFGTSFHYGLITARDGGDTTYWQLTHGGSGTTSHKVKFVLIIGGGNFVGISSNIVLLANTIYHIVISVNQAELTANIYINGFPDSEASVTAHSYSNTGVPVRVGLEAANSGFFSGELDYINIYNRSLTAAEVSNLYNKTQYAGLVRDGLVGYWDFTKQTVYDFSGNSNNGILTAGNGRLLRQGLLCDGNTSKVNIGDFGDYDVFSVLAAITPFAIKTQTIVSRRDTSIGSQYQLFLSVNDNKISFFDGSTTFTGPSVNLAGVPLVVGCVINGSSSQLYRDGNKEGSTFAPSMSSKLVDFLIGNIGTTNVGFDGLMSVIAVYNRALSTSEIAQNHQYFKSRGYIS